MYINIKCFVFLFAFVSVVHADSVEELVRQTVQSSSDERSFHGLSFKISDLGVDANLIVGAYHHEVTASLVSGDYLYLSTRQNSLTLAEGPGIPLAIRPTAEEQIVQDRRTLSIRIELKPNVLAREGTSGSISITDLVVNAFRAGLEKVQSDSRINYIAVNIDGIHKSTILNQLRKDLLANFQTLKNPPNPELGCFFFGGGVAGGLLGGVGGIGFDLWNQGWMSLARCGEVAAIPAGYGAMLAGLLYLGLAGIYDARERHRERWLNLEIPVTEAFRALLTNLKNDGDTALSRACEVASAIKTYHFRGSPQ